ncbi:MAG: hypothetical protein Q8K60_03320 [Parachlamydiaceae bacterium]|nr:hypothetical protein [Parachlamydiaceae bacterium]
MHSFNNNIFNSNTLIACAGVTASGALAASCLHRPPLIAGVMLGGAYLLKKAVIGQSHEKERLTLSSRVLDNVLPDVYLNISNSRSLTEWFEDQNLDFCTPGTYSAYFISQRIGSIIETILAPSDPHHVDSDHINNRENLRAYFLITISTGTILALNSSFPNFNYIVSLTAVAIFEKIVIPRFNTSKQVNRIFVNITHLSIPLIALAALRGKIPYIRRGEKISGLGTYGAGFIRGYTIANLFYSIYLSNASN